MFIALLFKEKRNTINNPNIPPKFDYEIYCGTTIKLNTMYTVMPSKSIGPAP